MKPDDFAARMRQHFDHLCTNLLTKLASGEEATINITAEETLYVRFNGNRVRQNTDVEQINLSLRLQSKGRTVEKNCTLGGQHKTDQPALTALLEACRLEASVLPVDPNQVPIENKGSSSEAFRGALLSPKELVSAVVGAA